MDEHRELNRAWWDERAPAHAASSDYAVRRLVDDPAGLSQVVQFDLPRLGDVAGLRGVHLQCHIGTDTLSLARLGAHMTGVDFSPAAVAIARDIAVRAGLDIDYVESEVYSAPDALGVGGFDLVYTGVGALIWLPDIDRWAQVVAALLRPGGRLFVRDGHPVLWAVDEERLDAIALRYPYFEHTEPQCFDGSGTYVDTDVDFATTATREWNHGLGEIVTALLAAGLRLTMLVEHDSVPWDALPGRMHNVDGEWHLTEHPERLPLSYTLQAVKPAQ
ncbi:SAM-dependent methyltransferase [Mycolicibacterium litorale]|nr:SAM-dependent methyltransferase [Mycolicibacterium litorale]